MSSIYNGADGSNVRVDLPFMNERVGKYEVEVERIQDGISNKDRMGFFKAQVQVVKSEGADAFPVGTVATIMIKEHPMYKTFQRDLVHLGAAILNVSPTKIKSDDLKALAAEDNPAEGTRFVVECYPTDKKVKSTGKVRNELKYAPVLNPGELSASV